MGTQQGILDTFMVWLESLNLRYISVVTYEDYLWGQDCCYPSYLPLEAINILQVIDKDRRFLTPFQSCYNIEIRQKYTESNIIMNYFFKI